MSRKVRLSRKAEGDILQIYLTGAATFGVVQADRYHDGLHDIFRFLAEYPLAARVRTELNPAVRVHPYKAHLVVYVVEEEGVLILRVRHGHEDWVNNP